VPNVFLLIIDSLRPDYVSPYNAAVSFTPAIGAFAGDSFVFRRAFSRYAGTGLSVPAIWAGSMLIHKQYVTPFAPTNALEKLVAAKGYRRLITEDHITEELFSPSPDTIGLDHGVPEMLHTFCRTTGEIGRHLEARRDAQPLFVMTRPLDLHIGNIASAKVPPGESYPGFHGPYAARVRQIDACFGELVETLKRLRLYDNSIIVITSDHGDSLGEGQRWGHGFTAFPEVLRIPLVIHLPPALRPRVSADLARVSFSTDITPTLYALLGEHIPAEGTRGTRGLLRGSPLFVDPSTDLSWRRRESYLVASSYGPVFGLLGRNGRRLYLADGVESREYAYELGPDGTDVRVAITDGERQASRRGIREQIGEIAAWHRFTPEP
jgi:arylsulfatase A-like enzyme